MITGMLVNPVTVAGLAGAVDRIRGNPYGAVELLDALRRDGLLSPRRPPVAVEEQAAITTTPWPSPRSGAGGQRYSPYQRSPGRWRRRWRAWAAAPS